MSTQTIELDGKRYVILPQEEYEGLRAQALDLDDGDLLPEEEAALIAKAKASMKEPSQSFEQFRQELGLG